MHVLQILCKCSADKLQEQEDAIVKEAQSWLNETSSSSSKDVEASSSSVVRVGFGEDSVMTNINNDIGGGVVIW